MNSHPFRLLANLKRSQEIAAVLLNHGFGDIADRLGLRRAWRRWTSWAIRSESLKAPKELRTVERIRMVLESLGPAYIKFGQVLSTRPDIIPPDMLAELARLQEQVPPVTSEVIVAEVERELGASISQLFREFQQVPWACGSLGQVHRAIGWDGAAWAVKIRRPGVVREVERDLLLMRELALLVERNLPELRVFDPVGLVEHFARTIRRELNFAREARTMDEITRLFANDSRLKIPRIDWSRSNEAILTMEFIEGLRVDEPECLVESGLSPADIAASGAQLFMKQAFEFGVFHSDPHPGNMRILPNGVICLLDFGMVGILEPKLRNQIADLFEAMSRHDLERITQLVSGFGNPQRELNYELLQLDVRDFLGNYYGVPLDRLHVGRLLTDLLGILTQHAIRCPASLMLLIRATVTLEGVGRQLDPQFNLAQHLAPFAAGLVKKRYQPQAIAERMYADARTLMEAAHDLPLHVTRAVEKLSRDDLEVHLEHRGLDHLILELERSSNRLAVGIVVASLILASALIMRHGADASWISLPVYVLSSLLAVWLIYGIFRSGRL